MSILSAFQKVKRYRKTESGYKLQSQWTSSETVEMADGSTLEHNLGNIKGITDSFDDDSTKALSSKAGKTLMDQLAALNSSLTSGTTQFYFDNHDGKFGWNSDPARGADTFHPFSEDGTAELYEALKYSGFVTADMSFEEMCAALADKFPGKLILFNGVIASGQSLHTAYYHIGGDKHTLGAQASITGGVIRSSVRNASGISDNVFCASWAFAKTIDLTQYKKLVAVCSTNTGGNTRRMSIGTQLPTTGANPFNVPVAKMLDISNVGTFEIDISGLNGKYYIWFLHVSTNSSTAQIVDFSEIYLSAN